MTLSPEIDYSTLDPKKLQNIITKLTEALKIGKQQALKTRQLRWALTTQMHLNQSVFWLHGKNNYELQKAYHEYYKEFELVFGHQSPYNSGSKVEDTSCWAMWEKRHWQEAHNIDENTHS